MGIKICKKCLKAFILEGVPKADMPKICPKCFEKELREIDKQHAKTSGPLTLRRIGNKEID